jgi:hypothetical protein
VLPIWLANELVTGEENTNKDCARLRGNPDCAAFNPTLLDGEQGKKRDDYGTEQN